jgi:hypothetical protein
MNMNSLELTAPLQSSRRRLPRLRFGLVCAGLILAALYAFSPNFRHASGPDASPFAGDFLQEWVGGWMVRAGEGGRFYDPAYAQQLEHDERLVGFAWSADEYLPMVYPPFYYLLVSPLSLIGFHAAAWVWAGLMVGALVASVWILDRWAERSQAYRTRTPGGVRHWVLLAAVLFAPVLESLSSSQKGTVCLLILTATFALWDAKRPLAAGLVFGLLAFKPQLTLVIALAALCKGQWRFVAGGMITGAVLIGLSLCVGLDVCRQYVDFALHAGDYMQSSGYDLFKSHSVWGFGKLLRSEYGVAGTLAAWGAALAVIVLTARALRGKIEPGTPRFVWQFSALVIASVLLCPHLFTYDLTVLLLPLALAVHSGNRMQLSLAPSVFVAPALSTAMAAVTSVQWTIPLLVAWLAALNSRGPTARGVSTARGISAADFQSDPTTQRGPLAPGYWSS